MDITGKLYKVLKKDGSVIYGRGKWHLPNGKRPGKWMPAVDKLVMCNSGYHLTDAKHLIEWIDEALFEAEYKGDMLIGDNKIVVSQARLVRKLDNWNERTERLFACDCAERVIHIFEKQYPKDKRLRNTINTSRNYANGKASKEELYAALAAALATARAAAVAAALAAAGAAALATARAAAVDAAGAAAVDAECKWQVKRLWEYLDGKRG